MQDIIRQYDPALTASLTAAAAESASKVATLLKRKAARANDLRAKDEPSEADVRLAGLLETEIGLIVDLIQDYKQLLAQRESEAASCWQMVELQDKRVKWTQARVTELNELLQAQCLHHEQTLTLFEKCLTPKPDPA